MLATNIGKRGPLGRKGSKLLDRIRSLGVTILPTEYLHRPSSESSTYLASRYVLDAIAAATEGQPGDLHLWLTDLDCVWVEPEKLFAARSASQVGCVFIAYPPSWDAAGFGLHARTREAIGELAVDLGGNGGLPPWIGGELLSGTTATLRNLLSASETLDTRLAEKGYSLPAEEQILTLAGALGEIDFLDLSAIAQRVNTGPRHEASVIASPLSLGLWHLPAEKGLSLRRAARQITSGRTQRLRRDLVDKERMARRFNVAGTGLARRLRDDGWIAMQRVRSVLSLLPRATTQNGR